MPTKLFAETNNLSEQSFVAPYKFTGLAALSVESAITFFTLLSIAASITFCAPKTFVEMHSVGLYSEAFTLHSRCMNYYINVCTSAI